MSFFPVPVLDETGHTHDEPRPAPWIAGAVPVELVAARSDRAAVVVKRIAAYPEGFELTITAVLHQSVVTDDGPCVDRFGMHRQGRGVPDDLLRVGLVWPDGGRATNLDDWGRNWATNLEPEASHGLEENAGSGLPWEMTTDYWAWPLPDDGALQLVVEWPAYGIPETVVDLDAALITAAAQRARPVFPEDADRPSHYSRAARMPRPDGGAHNA